MSGLVLLVAIAGTSCWGAQNYFGATVSRQVAATRAVLAMQALGFVMLLPVALVAPGHLSSRGLQWGAVAGVAGVFGWVLMFAASRVGQIAVTQKVCAGTSAIFPFIAGIIAGQHPSALPTIGFIVLVMALLVLMLRKPNSTESPVTYVPLRAASLALLAGIGLGLALVALGHTKPEDGIYPFVVYRFVVTIILVAVTLVMRAPLAPPTQARQSLLIAAFFSSLGDVAVLYALQHGSYLLIPAITSLYPAVTAVIAWRFSKERLTPSQIGAMAIAFVGLALMRA